MWHVGSGTFVHPSVCVGWSDHSQENLKCLFSLTLFIYSVCFITSASFLILPFENMFVDVYHLINHWTYFILKKEKVKEKKLKRINWMCICIWPFLFKSTWFNMAATDNQPFSLTDFKQTFAVVVDGSHLYLMWWVQIVCKTSLFKNNTCKKAYDTYFQQMPL